MFRYLAYGLLALVVVGGGYYFYQVHQIESRLDDLASQLRPVGRLEHDGVSLRPGGEIRVHGLRFSPRGMSERVTAERVVLRGESIPAALRMGRELEQGRLPRELGLGVQALALPVDGDIFEMVSDSISPGLGFDAVGCDGRDQFSVRDLTAMEYWDLVGDLDVSYRLSENSDRVDLAFTLTTREMSRTRFDVQLALSGASRDVQSLAGADVRLETASMTFEDLGYYDRMLAFCADETGLSGEEYRASHLVAWQEAWAGVGVDLGEPAVEAYRDFLASPGTLTIDMDPGSDFDPARAMGLSPHRLARHLGISVSVDDESYGSLAPSRADPSDTEDSGSDSPSTAEQLPWESPTEDAEAGQADEDGAEDDAEASDESEPDPLRTVPPSELGSHTGRWVVLRMRDGAERQGRVVEVDGDRVRLEQRMSGGYAVVPVSRAEIAEVRVIR